MGKANLDAAIRIDYLATIAKALSEHYDADVLEVSASELAIPVVDAEGNEKFVVVKVSVPRGTRNGNGGYTPYDGYGARDEWNLVKEDRADKAQARKEKAERVEKEKERKRNARKVVKNLNEKGLDTMIHEDEGD